MPMSFQISLELAAKKVYSVFVSTKTRRRDQLANFQVGNFEVQDKSMTRENGNAVETEQRISRAEIIKNLWK